MDNYNPNIYDNKRSKHNEAPTKNNPPTKPPKNNNDEQDSARAKSARSVKSASSEEFNDQLSETKSEDRTVFIDDKPVNVDSILHDDSIDKTVNVHQFYPIIELRSDEQKSRSSLSNLSDDSFGTPHNVDGSRNEGVDRKNVDSNKRDDHTVKSHDKLLESGDGFGDISDTKSNGSMALVIFDNNSIPVTVESENAISVESTMKDIKSIDAQILLNSNNNALEGKIDNTDENNKTVHHTTDDLTESQIHDTECIADNLNEMSYNLSKSNLDKPENLSKSNLDKPENLSKSNLDKPENLSKSNLDIPENELWNRKEELDRLDDVKNMNIDQSKVADHNTIVEYQKHKIETILHDHLDLVTVTDSGPSEADCASPTRLKPDKKLARRVSTIGLELATISEDNVVDEDSEEKWEDMNNSSSGVLEVKQEGPASGTEASITPSPPDIHFPEDIYTGNNFSMSDIIDAKVNGMLKRVERLKRMYNYVDAIRLLQKVMLLKPNVVDHYVECGECYLQMCDLQTSILYMKRACYLDPTNEEIFDKLAYIFYFQGQILFDQHLFEESLEAFTRATEIKPDNVQYATRGMACLAALGRHDECLALINKQLQSDSTNADLFVMRARLHQLFGNLTLVYYDAKEALKYDPHHEEATLILLRQETLAEECKLQGMRLMINGKYKEALQKLSSAIDINPSVDNYHIVRGALYRKMSDFNSAIDDFLLAPDKGALYRKMSDFNSAIDDFLLALDKCNHDESSDTYKRSQRQLLLTYNDFAVECFNKKYFDEAIVLLNKAIKGEKNEKGLYINRGDCFLQQDLTFALQDYHQALELDPYDQGIKSRISVVHGEFGLLAFQEKNFPEAEAKFSLAIQYNPRVGQHYISRARTRYMLDDIHSARQDLLLALLLDPTQEDILSIHARLFPGKSIGEVLASKAAQDMRVELEHLVSRASPVRLEPMSNQSSSTPLKVVISQQKKSTDTLPPPEDDIQPCVHNIKDLHHMAYRKKKINTDLRHLMAQPQNLTHKGPRLKTIPKLYGLGVKKPTQCLH